MKELRERVRDARLREAERLLKQERQGLEAVATAFLQLAPHPETLMERLDLMAQRAIQEDLPTRTRDVIFFGQQLFRRRLERHLLRQQELFPKDLAERLQEEPTRPPLLEPAALHGAQASAESDLKERVLDIYRNRGGLPDVELRKVYAQMHGSATSWVRVYDARVRLARQGLLRLQGEVWDLVERQ